MKLKKILFVSAAVAAMTGVMATGAFAAELSASWDAASQSVVITDGIADRDVYTVLVLATADDGSVLTEVTESDIKQINEQSEKYTEIKVGDLPAGTYEVRVGGDGTLDTGMFTVSGGDNPYYDDGTTLLGDASTNGEIALNDAIMIIDYSVGSRDVTKDALQAMDATENGEVALNDAILVIDYTVGDRSTLGTKTIADKATFVEVQ